MKLQGAITAMVTPFGEDGLVDYDGLKKNVEFQIANGISGLVPCGTTGESPTLSHDEHDAVIEAVVQAAKGRVPVIAGTGSNSTAEAIRLTKHAQNVGADAALMVSPYYNKPTQEGLYRHFTTVADAADLPLVVYNIQGRTAVNIETATLKRMAAHPRIVAVKEASGNLNQMSDVIAQVPELSVLSGDDSLTLPLMGVGGVGVISVVSNLVPRMVADMCDAALRGDFAAARQLHYRLLPFFRAAFIETNPQPIKAAMRMAGMPAGSLRLPLTDVSPSTEEALRAVLKPLGVLP